ncbi:MAG: leucyl/phenylalanyl-tRNA--protein transferase [Bacteroidales bacterium]|nr:leucyl/phenylalanyl-tRNA--protein transferase [Bacteroidales bacterium]
MFAYQFPEPEKADEEGFLAASKDLNLQLLIDGYMQGAFPWFKRGRFFYWFSPDPRMVLFPNEFRCSKSLRRTIKSGKYEVRIDTCFQQVITQCAEVFRIFQNGSWITKDYIEAYTEMHGIGLAHSFETFFEGQLVGGLYGLSLGAAFFGESMFHTMSDASKVAFAHLVDFCKRNGIDIIDAQQETPHLASLGAKPIPRSDFLQLLKISNEKGTLFSKWTNL